MASLRAAVIGRGGREHALAWFLRRSGWQVWGDSSHPGLAALCQPLPAATSDPGRLAQACVDLGVDLVVFGPEAPLVAGAADQLRRRGLTVLGPGAAGARLEGSKLFAKQWMQRHGLPTGQFRGFADPQAAWHWARQQAEPPVIKADGLAAGKGVHVPADWQGCRSALDDLLVRRRCGEAGATVVVEERLHGAELSALAVVGGGHFVLLPPVRDFKRAADGDRGPQTGGMGALAPLDDVDPAAWQRCAEQIFAPALRGLGRDGLDFRGVLYAGLMWTASGPKVLEFNVRFGDPEAQALLPLLGADLADVWLRAARGGLQRDEIWPWPSQYSTAVVVAAAGYPGEVAVGAPVFDVEPIEMHGASGSTLLFAGSVAAQPGGPAQVAGGRVATAVGVAASPAVARSLAYQRAQQISFDGAWFRTDIGLHAPAPFAAPP